MAQVRPDFFIGSYIYNDIDKQVMEYNPGQTLNRDSMMVVHPVKTSETYSNDCLIEAMNFFLRWPYFTHQMQVLRLSARNLKCTLDYVNNLKIAGGV